MDNKAYLDSIAVKGQNTEKKPLLSPALIKFFILGIVVIVTLLSLLVVIQKANQRDYSAYSELYLRTQNIVSEESPVVVYPEKLKSSNLRSWSAMLVDSIEQLNAGLDSQLNNEGFDASSIDEETTASEDSIFSSYQDEIEEAYMSGMLDRTYAYETYYQISLIIAAEEAVIDQSTDAALKSTLEKNVEDLEVLEEKFLDYSNKH